MNQQKSFVNIILVVVIIVLLGVVGYFVFIKKSEPIAQQPTLTIAPTLISAPTSSAVFTPKSTPVVTEKASGIIKSIYSKSGKNYLDIDYVELNPNWVPGGMSALPAYQNNNPKIRTFEISSSAKFFEGSRYITLSEFQKFFVVSNSPSYQSYNPWDIVITDGMVVEIKEHYIP